MKICIEAPKILEEQKKIFDWSRKLHDKYIGLSTIIEYLVSDKKSQSDIINDGLEEVREVYQKYNEYWREQILTALFVDEYRLRNDVRKGDLCTNGTYIGYAFDINYESRKFQLYGSKNKKCWIGIFKIDDFEIFRKEC